MHTLPGKFWFKLERGDSFLRPSSFGLPPSLPLRQIRGSGGGPSRADPPNCGESHARITTGSDVPMVKEVGRLNEEEDEGRSRGSERPRP